jgi:hypothetical protein
MTKGKIGDRFGMIAISKGFISFEQFIKAMAIQIKDEIEIERHTIIGKILMDQGLLNKTQVDEVLELMKNKNE